ncbi:MAG TPA: hypothetical protein VNZ52_00670 [Candidatus Thermoplasmatota archaeon]|nr:hypothetical protein [Candidatus Thermoplasmatota archaeon]
MPRLAAALLMLALAVTLPGCMGGESPQQVRACEPGGWPEGTLEVVAPGNEAPGRDFSVKLTGFNAGNCTLEVEAQNITFAFKDVDGNVVNSTKIYLYGSGEAVARDEGPVIIGPRQTGNLGDFQLVAPQQEGEFTLAVKMEQLGWEGEEQIRITPRSNSTTRDDPSRSSLPAA